MHEKITDGEYYDDDKYENTSENQFIKNMLFIPNSELNCTEEH